VKVNLREILIILLIFLVVFTVVQLSLQSFRVDGPSMEPTFEDGQFLMINKLTYRFQSPHRGDVIVFWPPFHSEYPFIKRVVGLPGELVEIRNGKIFIDGVLYEEEPTMQVTPRTTSVLVPEDRYFVLGDNRDDSRDSSEGWTVPESNIIGKTWVCYWPPSDWGLTPGYSYELGTTA
jgi:signal peptidase I